MLTLNPFLLKRMEKLCFLSLRHILTIITSVIGTTIVPSMDSKAIKSSIQIPPHITQTYCYNNLQRGVDGFPITFIVSDYLREIKKKRSLIENFVNHIKYQKGIKMSKNYMSTTRAKMISVIEVKSVIGTGTQEDVSREVTDYFLPEGQLIAHIDPCDEDTVPLGWNGYCGRGDRD